MPACVYWLVSPTGTREPCFDLGLKDSWVSFAYGSKAGEVPGPDGAAIAPRFTTVYCGFIILLLTSGSFFIAVKGD